MAVRLSELAKELGTTKKELLEKLPALGYELKKSIVDVDEQLAEDIRRAIDRAGIKFAPPVVKKPARPRARTAEKARTKAAPKARAAKKAPARATRPDQAELPEAEAEAEATAPAVEVAASVAEAPPPSPAQPEPPAPQPVLPQPPLAPASPSERPEPPTVVLPPAPTRTTPPIAARSISPRPAPAGSHPPGRRPGGPGPRRSEEGQPETPAAGRTAPGAARTGRPEGGRSRPEMPRTTPKAPRPTSARPVKGRKGGRRRRQDERSRVQPTPPPSTTPIHRGPLKEATLSEGVSVKELSEKLEVRTRDLIRRLMERGIFATINQALDKEIATELARDFGYDARIISFEEESTLQEVAEEKSEDLVVRPPVVTVMGHVDHGKTTLLDAIRETNVAAREAGQITQHIGAYQVVKKDRPITFLDTPGHEAFTMMRARGARVTDIVVLVVAADDGVMPQTIEAIHHAKAAGVPIIVAINKIDLPNANPDRVTQMLADQGLLAEDWGGDTVMVRLSAKKHIGLEDLLDLILLVADLQDLKSNPARAASGVVLEAKLDRGRGAVATVLVQAGTLRSGDPFIAGAVHGKVRAMFDDRGDKVEDASPSTPVEVLGLNAVPKAGDLFQVVADDFKARQMSSFRQQQQRELALAKTSRLTLDQLYRQIAEGAVRELPIVLKGDVQGSVEALNDALNKLSSDSVKVRIIHSGTGAVSESDVLLASASNAIIVGFNVRPDRKARELAEHEKVDIRLHTIIYAVTEEIEKAMEGLLEPTFEESVLGRVEIRELFRVPRIGVVAGCYVQEGRITRDSQIRLLRDNVVIFDGKLASLKRFKDDVSEVRQGYECGLSVANYQDLKVGDVLEPYKMEKVEPRAS